MWKIDGCNFLSGAIQILFKSTPVILHLVFPLMTPSGFNMGTILNTKVSRSILAPKDGPSRQSIIPFIMKLEFVSPGCTLDEITTPLRFFISSKSEPNVVMISKSTGFPATVLQNSFLRNRVFFLGSDSRRPKYLDRSLYVYGQL